MGRWRKLCPLPSTGLKAVLLFHPPQHCFSGDDLLCDPRRCSFNIYDDRMIRIDQIVVEVAQFAASFLRVPCGGWVSWREISCIALMNRVAGIKRFQILAYGPCCIALANGIHALDAPITPSITADQAAVGRETLATQPAPRSCTG